MVCYASGPTITGNTFRYFPNAIKGAFSAFPLIKSNIFLNNDNAITGVGGIIENNTIGSCTHNAIENCEAYVVGNTIKNNSGDGLYQCNSDIRNNTIINNTGNGLRLCTGLVYENEISRNSTGLSSCDAIIERNKISENLGDGISGGSGSIKTNTITANLGKGVVSFNGDLTNNLIAANGGDGVDSCTALINNTIVENSGNAVANCSGVVKNNILAYNHGKGVYGASDNSYNCFWLNDGGSFYNNYGKVGDIYGDPHFAMLGSRDGESWISGDYHLQSEYGRWNEVLDSWETDLITSRCVDAGDPEYGILSEPNPNGGRINIGAYGGSEFASMALSLGPDPNEPPQPSPVCVNPPRMDVNGDCKVNMDDFAVLAAEWLSCGYADPNDCDL